MAQSKKWYLVIKQETKEKDLVQMFVDILKTCQQSNRKFPTIVVSDNPRILIEPYKVACRRIYGDVTDARYETKFMRDIHPEIQHPCDDDKNAKSFCEDVDAVMNSIRG